MKLIPAKAVVMQTSNVSVVPDTDNRDYMFDAFLNTQTVYATLIEVEIDFDNVDRIALFNIDGTDVDLVLTDDDASAVVQTKNIDLEMSDGEYKQWIIEPMYIYANATLKVTINNAGTTAKCGMIGTGLSTDIGDTLPAPTIGFTDYSIKTSDTFGQYYLVAGAWAKLPSITTKIDYGNIDNVYEDLVAVRGALAFFEGNNTDTDYETLRVYGYLEDWRIKIDNASVAWVTFNIKGAI